MPFLVILVCFILQWSLNLSSVPHQRSWEQYYVSFMQKKFSTLAKGHNLFGVVVYVLPIVIVASLLFTIVYHLFGHLGYLLFSLALLWYCSDAAILKHDVPDVFSQSYQKIFSVIFWYFIFGPVGLVLYVVVRTLHTYFVNQKDFTRVLSVMDWVPMRLVGLSFALVGNFAAVFKDWIKVAFRGTVDMSTQISAWGAAALGNEKSSAERIALTRRALIVWLVVMALITIGIWVG